MGIVASLRRGMEWPRHFLGTQLQERLPREPSVKGVVNSLPAWTPSTTTDSTLVISYLYRLSAATSCHVSLCVLSGPDTVEA